MDFLEPLQKVVPWASALPLIPKILVSAIIVAITSLFLLLIWTPQPTRASATAPQPEHSPSGAVKHAQMRFITEGVKVTRGGFAVAFSVMNTGGASAKLYSIETRQYAHIPSVQYFGGPRSILKLSQNEDSLWKGETFEIPPGESASFELRYTVTTGPADGEPWVILGVLGRYHSLDAVGQTFPSDALYVYSHGSVSAATLDTVTNFNSDNWFLHEIYADILQILSVHGVSDRPRLAQLMKQDYGLGFDKLGKLIAVKGDQESSAKLRALQIRLTHLTDLQANAPLRDDEVKEQQQVREELRQLAMKNAGLAFIHLCSLEKATEPTGR